METFDYAAIDKSGKRLTGSLAAVSGREARDLLRGRDLTPVSIKAAKTKAASPGATSKKVPHKDLTQATRQLAILIDAATPIEQAVKIVALQFEKSPMRGVLLDVRAKVLEGARLSEALRAHPKTFDDLYVALIASGEGSGRLAAVMDRLASDMEAAQKIRRKIVGATVYPIVLSVVALADRDEPGGHRRRRARARGPSPVRSAAPNASLPALGHADGRRRRGERRYRQNVFKIRRLSGKRI